MTRLHSAHWFTQQNSKSGFTLIEMLVTVAIATLFVGGGMAGFLRFNSRQKAINASKEFEQVIRQAEAKTQNGVVGACTQLDSYEITFNTAVDPVIVSLTEKCAAGDPGVPVPVQYSLTQGVSVNFNPATTYIRSKILSGGLVFDSGASSIDVQFSDTNDLGQTYVVTISEGGVISEGIWQ